MPAKRDVARALLLKGSIFVHLDPRVPGVCVPNDLKVQPQLVLQFGLDMLVPIPDMRVDKLGIHGTLSFQRSPCVTSIPWDAVFAVVGEDGRGMVWPKSMPKEIAAEVEREAQRAQLAAVERASGEDGGATMERSLRHSATRVRGDELAARRVSQPPAAQAAQGARAGSSRRRQLPPYLRIVK